MSDLSIGQLADALRQKCMEDLGVEVQVKLYTHVLDSHDQAEMTAIAMTNELGGRMTGIQGEPGHHSKWYDVYGKGCDYHAFFPAKEKITAEAV